MGNRKVPLLNNEYYHIYNRGVDKRKVFMYKNDVVRFLRSMQVFNTVSPVGSLNKTELPKYSNKSGVNPLVNIIAYCLNPNHFHFILEQVADGGISEFMKRLSGGYTCAFNKKYGRSGVLFQGRFKSIHINNDSYLLHLSAYVNLNYKVHRLSGSTAKLSKSSWDEYISTTFEVCKKDIVLSQFSNKKSYKKFAELTLIEILKNKREVEELELSGSTA